jgi:hypothetical protein
VAPGRRFGDHCGVWTCACAGEPRADERSRAVDPGAGGAAELADGGPSGTTVVAELAVITAAFIYPLSRSSRLRGMVEALDVTIL